MDAGLREEARQLIASARAQIEECWEEGVESIDAALVRELLGSTSTGPAPSAPAAQRPARSQSNRGDTPRAASPPSELARSAPTSPTTVEAPSRFGSDTTLDQVRESLGECSRCGLCEGRKTIVFGDGNARAELMFVGEGPGQQEDETGLPFVGRAGELLTQMIEKGLGLARRDVYICNIVKCRPPNNRTPLPNEVASCKPFLDGQIDAVRPQVIVALGKPATSLLLGREVSITRVRGTWQEYRGIPVMPTFHPAFVLRQYTPENRRKVWEDLKNAMARARGE